MESTRLRALFSADCLTPMGVADLGARFGASFLSTICGGDLGPVFYAERFACVGGD
jgi:hypothetical protein